MKLVIITSDPNGILARAFSNMDALRLVVYEKRHSPWHFIPFYSGRLLKRPFKTFLEIIYQCFKLFFHRENRLRGEKTFCSGCEFMETTSANSDEVLERLVNLKPDIILLGGTSIIKKEILKTALKGVINIHLGINPVYRGGGNLFACIKRDWDNMGATVHMVDRGIDTGTPLKYLFIRPDKNFKSFHEYERYCYEKAVEELFLIVNKIHEGENGDIFVDNAPEGVSAYYPQPDIISYMKCVLNFRKRPS